MGQDRATGAAGNHRDREDARTFAKAIGATMLSGNSNDAILDSQHITIRSAKMGNTAVGCYLHVLDRVDEVYAAFEEKLGLFCIMKMSAEAFRARMTTKDSIKGANGQVSKSAFFEFGDVVKRDVSTGASTDS